MSIVEYLAPVLGVWNGVNRLRMMPTDDYVDSVAEATIDITARAFVTISYTWEEDGDPQDGLLLIGDTPEDGGFIAVWADSWHTAPTMMSFTGNIDADGSLKLDGFYAAPSGPDWGWQIQIDPPTKDQVRITMHNVVPGLDPYQVVEMSCQRWS